MKKSMKLCLTLLIVFSCVLEIKNGIWADEKKTVTDGVYIENINVSGMTFEQARNEVKDYINDVSDQRVTLVIGDEKVDVTASDLGYKWENRGVINEALSYGQSGNVIARYKAKETLKHEDKVFAIDMSVHKKTVKSTIKEVSESLGSTAKNASLKLVNGEFEITKEKSGVAMDIDSAVDTVYDYMLNDWATDSIGCVTLPTEMKKAEYTTEDCEKVSTTPMGSYTTNFSVYSDAENRNKNMENGVNKLDGLVVYPGEEISCNEVFLPFTEENGYYEAGAFIDGEVATDIGGGICQVSTTLYNALLRAEIEITQRLNHSMTVTYVPLACDAAITGDYKDLKFKNDTNAPIYIEGIFSWGGSLTFNVYGYDERPEGRTLEFESETISTTEPGEKITKDDTLPSDYEEIVTQGYTGYVAKLWKYVYMNGELEDKVLINTSTYRATDTEKIVGTGGKSDDDDDTDEETTKKKKKHKKETTTTEDTTKETTTEEDTKEESTPEDSGEEDVPEDEVAAE